MSKTTEQQELFQAQTTWFHVFNAMVDNGDVAKMGPYAVTVYLVIKSFTNWKSGQAFPAIDTIVEKTGISERQVKYSLKTLEENGYITIEKKGRHNVYRLREKIEFTDGEGRPAAVATWDYLPRGVEAARAELQRFKLTGAAEGMQIVNIERLIMNVQIINGNEGDIKQINFGEVKDKALREQLEALYAAAQSNRK